MSTTMTHALRQAGLTIPQNQRIWQWLKDKGPHLSEEIAKALNIKEGNVSSLCNDMVKRGMMRMHEEKSRKSSRKIARWEAMGKEYELLPIRAEYKPKKVAPVPVTPPVVSVTVSHKMAELLTEKPAEPTPADKAQQIISSNNLEVLHTLWTRLNTYFRN